MDDLNFYLCCVGGVHGRFAALGRFRVGPDWQQVAVGGRTTGMDVPSGRSSRSRHFYHTRYGPGEFLVALLLLF